MTKKNLGLIGGVIVIGIVLLAVLWHRAAPLTPTTTDNGNTMAVAKPLKVVASFYPEYFLASKIGGDKAEVINITPADAEPHDYEPTPQDIAAIEGSHILVLNGGVEAWGESVQKNLDPKKTLVVTVGEGLETQKVIEDGESIIDPHIWQSPVLVKQMIDRIEQGYAKVDPAHADYYATNAKALKSQLDQLDSEFKTGLATCAKKDIITSHAAFGYLATTYGLNQVSIAGLSPDAEPSPKQLADITDFAKKNNVKYIFFESLVSPKLSETIAKEVGAQTMVLDPIEGLSAEDLASGKDYLTVMRTNLANLRIALECQ